MKKHPAPQDVRECIYTFGGIPSTKADLKKNKQIRLLRLIWRLVKIFFRYGNQEIYYHICGSNSWDVPMEAENVEIRQTLTGPHVTIW